MDTYYMMCFDTAVLHYVPRCVFRRKSNKIGLKCADIAADIAKSTPVFQFSEKRRKVRYHNSLFKILGVQF